MTGIKSSRCGRGHAWTAQNTGTRSSGHRYCKKCVALRSQERRARLKIKSA
jgi:late competence protein required for DNA uptake (superfamily II DNA/RNA helicase)